MTEFSLTSTINAPKERVWDALRNFGDISIWNPGVLESHSTSETTGGLGAERRCDLGNGRWIEEEIIGWEDGKSLDINIVDSNVPLSRAVVSISAEALDDATTRVDLSINYKLKFGPVGAVMDLVMGKRSYRKGMSDLLAGLKHYSETGEEVGSELPTGATL